MDRIAIAPPVHGVNCKEGDFCLELTITNLFLTGFSKVGLTPSVSRSLRLPDRAAQPHTPALALPSTVLQLKLPVPMSRLMTPRMDKVIDARIESSAITLAVRVATLRPVMTWLGVNTRWGEWYTSAVERDKGSCFDLSDAESATYRGAYASMRMAADGAAALADAVKKKKMENEAKAKNEKLKTKAEWEVELKAHQEILARLEAKMSVGSMLLHRRTARLWDIPPAPPPLEMPSGRGGGGASGGARPPTYPPPLLALEGDLLQLAYIYAFANRPLKLYPPHTDLESELGVMQELKFSLHVGALEVSIDNDDYCSNSSNSSSGGGSKRFAGGSSPPISVLPPPPPRPLISLQLLDVSIVGAMAMAASNDPTTEAMGVELSVAHVCLFNKSTEGGTQSGSSTAAAFPTLLGQLA